MAGLLLVEYSERLHVPLRWWVQGTMFLATFWLAFVVALPTALAWVATGVLAAGLASLFLGYGSARIEVVWDPAAAEGTLRAGRARVPLRLLGTAVELAPAETKRAAGVDADARAYLLLRPYLSHSVRVTLADPEDPTPYWLLASRNPAGLVAALRAATGDAGHHDDGAEHG